MVLVDKLRTLMGIRRPRRLPPAGPQPPLGSNIVNGRVRMRLKYAIGAEQWAWLSMMGWRTVDMRQNRRHYEVVSDKLVYRLVTAEDADERSDVHREILAIQGGDDDAPVHGRFAA